MFDYLLSNSEKVIPLLFLISLALKSIYFNSNREENESNNRNEIIDKVVHDYHDNSEKTVAFCPHCDKKYKIPQNIGSSIRVKCSSCNKLNYHNI